MSQLWSSLENVKCLLTVDIMQISSTPSTAEYIQHAITAYKGEYGKIGATRINEFLRSFNIGDDGKELITMKNHPTIRHLSAIVQEIDRQLHPNTYTKTVFRGIPLEMFTTMKQQGFIVNKAYTSCAWNIEVAKDYGPIILCFQIPSTLNTYSFAKDDYEKEIIIERNTMFMGMHHIRKEKEYTYIDVALTKYIPPKPTLPLKKAMSEPYKETLEHMESEEIDWDDI
jgi:hypothetical protein